jgi:hypothetical protein
MANEKDDEDIPADNRSSGEKAGFTDTQQDILSYLNFLETLLHQENCRGQVRLEKISQLMRQLSHP